MTEDSLLKQISLIIYIINNFDTLRSAFDLDVKTSFNNFILKSLLKLIKNSKNTDIKAILKAKESFSLKESEEIIKKISTKELAIEYFFLCWQECPKVRDYFQSHKNDFENYVNEASLLKKIRLRKFFNSHHYGFVNYIDEKITEILVQKEFEANWLEHFETEDFTFIKDFNPKRLFKCRDKVAISSFLVGSILLSSLFIKKNNKQNYLLATSLCLIGIPVLYGIKKLFKCNTANNLLKEKKYPFHLRNPSHSMRSYFL